jgi:hypothetical protein
MKKSLYLLTALVWILPLCSCHYATYTPRSRSQQQLAKPSIVLLDRIVEFRENFNEWPLSKEYFMAKGPRYKEVFNGFRYLYTEFKIVDNDHLLFYFDQHIKDEAAYRETGLTDLNKLNGVVKFYKQDGKFLWKIRMN